MRAYKRINHRIVKDAPVRDALRLIDQALRQLSNQSASPPIDLSDNTVGNMVRSLEATTKRSGDLKLTSSSSILPSNSSNNFSFALTAIPSTVLPPTHWKATNTYTYGTARVAGTATTFARSDDVLVYPEALGTAANRAKTITLTDDTGDYDAAVLECASGFSNNELCLRAPNATADASGCVFINSSGSMGVGGHPSSQAKLLFTATLTGAASTAQQGLNGTLINSQTTTPFETMGGQIAVTGQNVAGADAIGYRVVVTPRNTGVGYGYKAKITKSGNSTQATAVNFESEGYVGVLGGTITLAAHFRASNLGILGTVTKQVAFSQPTAWSSGGTKRGVDVQNSVYIGANDVICDTAAKGLVAKDAQATPEYWRIYPSATGLKDATWATDADGFASFTRAASATGVLTLNVQDVGTAAPTT